jgi:hypothetical protein
MEAANAQKHSSRLAPRRYRSRAQKVRQVSVYSQPATWAKIDGRTKTAKRLRQITEQLTDYAAGGTDRITAPQRFLIDRLAHDLVRLELLDGRMAAGEVSEKDAVISHALRNSTRLALRDLARFGAQPARNTDGDSAKPPDLAEVIADISRKREP